MDVCKRRVSAYLSVILIIFSITFASAVGDVAYIYSKSYKIDNNIIKSFNDLGLSVDNISITKVSSTDLTPYRLIYVGDERFTNPNLIPITNNPTIIANYYHGLEWGLTDNEGISKISGTEPLKVKKGSSILQVYTDARYFIGSSGIPYYYLEDNNKAPGLKKIVGTYNGNAGYDFGDVVSTADQGIRLLNGKYTNDKLCYFGLETIQPDGKSSDYWTNSAKQLFNECVDYVGAACFNNAECGTNSNSSNFCLGDNVYKNVSTSLCENPGKLNSACTSNVDNVLVETCSDTCNNGACVPIACKSDNDCNDLDSHTKDTCNLPGTYLSYCTYQNITCLSNSECNDNKNNTEDVCNLPGTVESSCSNNDITCFSSVDCGINGYIGGPTCSSENVYQDYKTYSCLNPGTSQSSCISNISSSQKQVCNNGCENGQCIIPIACKNNGECDDNILNTEDICHSAGTPESYCTNEPIGCFNDSDCGINKDGKLYCSGKDVKQNSTTFKCNNPGKSSSFCSQTEKNNLINTCDDLCLNGACKQIICSSNSECDDGDARTVDQCANPGTTASFCRN